jgi:CHAT domain-containing protein/Tfp pilus assembly protein PilF
MVGQIWKSLVRFFQRLFGLTPEPQPVVSSPQINPLTPPEYESLFMQLLDGVDQDWSRGRVRGFLMAKCMIEGDLVAWLQGFGRRLLESPEPNLELAQRMVQLGEVGSGEIAEIAQEFGTKLLARAISVSADFANFSEHRDAEAWFYRGIAEHQADNLQAAFVCYKRTLEIVPEHYTAWNNLGVVLKELGLFENAITSYNQALVIQPKNPLAWNNRGEAFFRLEGFEEAIASYDHALQLTNNQYWMAWANRGEALFKLRGYQAAVQNWNEALQSLQLERSEAQKAYGWLHRHNGDAHYQHGKLQENPFPYWRYAYGSYRQALKFLTALNLRQQRLEVLQVLITVCRALGKTKEAQVLLEEGTDLLGRLLQETPFDADKIRLSRKFAGFDQLRVDALVQAGNCYAALELAEQRKNLYLGWLHYRWSESAEDSPNYAQMQELLQPSPTGKDAEKAIIYWHISPTAITTFILRYQQPPLVLSAKADLTPPAPLPYKGMGESDSPLLAGEGLGERFFYPPSLHQLVEFENWIETWKKDYQKYRQGTRQRNEENRQETQETPVSSSEQKRWLEEMPEGLKRLAKILNIKGILSHLKGVSQLILIPHRDLHLLPLHALFPNNFTITYLPSIKVGLDRKKAKQNAIPQQPKVSLLSVENPTDDLRYASLESELVSKLYPNTKSLSKSAATPEAVKEALSKGVGIFHFTGHGEHDLDQPAQSALILADKKRLTLRDFLELDLSHCNLVCLSACETNLTGKVGLIDEFVGLASGFVAAGVNNVVGSLWNVNDLSTAYLMSKFHEIRKKPDNPDVASALKQAQYLLRNVTNKELQEWQQQLPLELSQYRSLRIPVRRTDRETDADDKPFKSPFYWAAFCAIGL